MKSIPRTKQTLLAWRQGDAAHLDGEQPALANPYHPTTDSYRAWLRGWDGKPFDERGGFASDGVEHVDTVIEEDVA